MTDFPPLQDALRVGLPQLLNGQEVLVGFPVRVPYTIANVTSGTSLPLDLEAKSVAGFIRPTVLDNPDDGVTRLATVDIEFFCTRYDRGMAIAERISGILLSETRIGGVVLDRRTTSGPKEVRWDDNDNVRRFLSTHRISTRR